MHSSSTQSSTHTIIVLSMRNDIETLRKWHVQHNMKFSDSQEQNGCTETQVRGSCEDKIVQATPSSATQDAQKIKINPAVKPQMTGIQCHTPTKDKLQETKPETGQNISTEQLGSQQPVKEENVPSVRPSLITVADKPQSLVMSTTRAKRCCSCRLKRTLCSAAEFSSDGTSPIWQ